MKSTTSDTAVLFSTGCSPYFDWQSLGLAYSARHTAQPELKLTRLLSACADDVEPEDRERRLALPYMRTYEHPDYADPRMSGVTDAYALYNKPAGVLHWLQSPASSEADLVLLLEADMLLRGPIDCAAMGVRPGVAASSRYEYLVGATNGLARHFVKNAHLVQPVGGWVCLHKVSALPMASDSTVIAPRLACTRSARCRWPLNFHPHLAFASSRRCRWPSLSALECPSSDVCIRGRIDDRRP